MAIFSTYYSYMHSLRDIAAKAPRSTSNKNISALAEILKIFDTLASLTARRI